MTCRAKRTLFQLAALVPILAARALHGGELRGVWVDRSSLASRDEIRATLRGVARANLNTVFVNAWSRGYPLWRSKVFEDETGIAIDPGYAGRDPLQEFIDEAKPLGIAVVPWMEYGFVGGYSGYLPGPSGKGPIFEKHPEWLARDRSGSDRFPIAGGGDYYWLAHANPEAQEFLLRMMEEVAATYDVPAIEFDRARYPSLDCGYDDATKALYASEFKGAAPPDKIDEAAWVRWRADKLNEFHRKLGARIRAADWRVLVTDAPVTTPFGYVNFAQDYPEWIRQKSLDFVSPQIYRRTAADYEAELKRNLDRTGGEGRLVPGIDITNSNSAEELAEMIRITRAHRLPGFVVWYYRGLVNANALEKLRETVLLEPAAPPWRNFGTGTAPPPTGEARPDTKPDASTGRR